MISSHISSRDSVTTTIFLAMLRIVGSGTLLDVPWPTHVHGVGAKPFAWDLRWRSFFSFWAVSFGGTIEGESLGPKIYT